jgi:cytochrome c oxidase subunit 3
MLAILLFMAVIGGVIAWWLSRQRLMSKPWLEEGLAGEPAGGGRPLLPPAKVGLGVFLAVVGALFALMVSAFLMRSTLPDWQSMPVPNLLWSNTAALIVSSIALHWARHSIRKNWFGDAATGLVIGGGFALLFLLGQIMVWRQFQAAGYGAAVNPANAFFLMIVAVHGLHLLGGMVALVRAAHAIRRGDLRRMRLRIELCATYWHFLLAVWLIMLALMTRTVQALAAFCGQLFA